MFRSLMTIIKELNLYLTKVIFMLNHWVKLRRYIYIYGDVATCRRAACALFIQHAKCMLHIILSFVACLVV